MNRIITMTLAALASGAALAALPVTAETISNPTNSYSLGSLSGDLTGGNQTQYLGQTFTAPITGDLTDFQFTLNSSTLRSLYGIVYLWNGTAPTTEIWRSATVAGTQGVQDFRPVGARLTQGQTYVAFLSTFGIQNNAGLASMATCLTFVGCNSNTIPNLGTLIIGNNLAGTINFNPVVNNSQDATFSATITAPVPEPATWAMMIAGFGVGGIALRRRRPKVRVGYAA